MSAPSTQEEWAFKSRGHTAQIETVDTRNGTMSVRLLTSHERYKVDIPCQLDIQGITSSWARGMPQTNSYAEIGFGPRNNAYCIRLMTWAGPDVDHGGYKLAADAAARSAGSLDLIWKELEEGEFDLRSAGGAGYFFSKDGEAVIRGGATRIALDSDRLESVGVANLWRREGDGVGLRYGDVKRKLLPASFEESAVPLNPTSMPKPKEWRVEVGYLTPPAGTPQLTFYKEEAGDVRSSVGAPEVGGTGQPLRYRKTLYGADGTLEVLRVEADVLGNVKVVQGARAVLGGIDVDAATNPLKVSCLKADLTTTSFLNLNAGGVADSEMVRGTQLALYFMSKLSVMTALGPSGPAIVPLLPGVELSLLGRVK